MEKDSQADRLKRAIAESGKSQRQIALSAGMQRQAITNAIRRNRVSADMAQAVAGVTGHRWEWIYTGEGEPRATVPALRTISQGVRHVPVLSLAQARSWPKRVGDSVGMGEVAVDQELADDLSDTAFCVAIDDDSMRDGSPESVQKGDKVIVDPGVTARPGDFVIASMGGQVEATFRRYRERGIDTESGAMVVELSPLNADYAAVSGVLGKDIHIVGVMVEHRRRRRSRH